MEPEPLLRFLHTHDRMWGWVDVEHPQSSRHIELIWSSFSSSSLPFLFRLTFHHFDYTHYNYRITHKYRQCGCYRCAAGNMVCGRTHTTPHTLIEPEQKKNLIDFRAQKVIHSPESLCVEWARRTWLSVCATQSPTSRPQPRLRIGLGLNWTHENRM